MKMLCLALAALGLAACATGAKPGAMAAAVSETTLIDDSSPLRSAFSVGTVSGGKDTSPLWKSNVSSEDFAEALRQSLAANTLLAEADGKYRIDATLVQVKQPALGGFNMKVTSTIAYKVTDVASSAVVFDDEVVNEYVAKMGDAMLGFERLRLANEGSIKGNITKFLEGLIATMGTPPAPVSAEPAPESAEPQS